MILTLILSDNCEACDRAKMVLSKIHLDFPGIAAEIIHIDAYNDRRISITPALLINNKLFCYGDMDEMRLNKKIASGQNTS